jgi:mono/diheme cytochrome c family protein
MLKVLKWFGIVLGAILGLILLALLAFYTKSRMEFSKTYAVEVPQFTVPADSAAVARGEHLATVLCLECHGDDMSGIPNWIDLGPLGAVDTPNLTPGQGGLGGELSDEDLVRVLLHGVKPDATSVFVMPSPDFHYLSDQDLGDVIAYIRSLPPVDRQTGGSFTFLGGAMYGAGMFGDLLQAPKIDHAGRPPAPPAPGVSAEYGGYLVRINSCRDCHGQELAGGRSSEPGAPLAPNLTPGGELRAWTEEQFITTLRTGVTPSGTEMKYMPWKYKGRMTDDELKAIFQYLSLLPALPTSTETAQ